MLTFVKYFLCASAFQVFSLLTLFTHEVGIYRWGALGSERLNDYS